MTPGQLDMHKRLQPLYKRIMGEIGVGDYVYSPASKLLIYVDESHYYFLKDPDEERFTKDVVRIPLTIDSEHPERGLWGMLNWIEVCISIWGDGKVSFGEDYFQGETKKTDPTTAILKVLCEQEGV